MCGGIQYQDHKIYFPQPEARLPVNLRNGGITWVVWGRRGGESSGKFPNGGWARIDSIKSFMEKDHEKQSHWISLAPGMAIQGLLAEREE